VCNCHPNGVYERSPRVPDDAAARPAATHPPRYALRARYVFPVTSPPIPNGVVTIACDRIVAVGKEPVDCDAEDLGNVALLPGLVNAHTHLDLGGLSAPLGEPGIGMADWIRRVMMHRREEGKRGQAPFVLSTLRAVPANGACPLFPSQAVQAGVEESMRLGTTTLGDIAQPGAATALFEQAPIDATIFLELIAPVAQRIAAACELARQHVAAGVAASGWHVGLSPHAPYSVHLDLLRQVVALSAACAVPLAVHLAESREEMELLRTGGGPLAELLEDLAARDPTAIPPGIRPLDYLRILAGASRSLVIHGNYLDREEIAFLAKRADRMTVVYCPRTHAWFGHKPYPLEELLAAGAAVALGTDSRASSPDLSVLAEMRALRDRHPAIRPEVILQLGTTRGAHALGRGGDVGVLEAGRMADLAAVALPDRDATDPHELLLDSTQPVVRTYSKGLGIRD
jgi:aminodeoxyfutalosine deaminase